MSLIFIVAALVSLTLLGVALWALVRRLSRAPQQLPDGDWLARFSAARYRPMERLLDPADEAFVASQGDRKMLRRFRAQRRKVFRAYLRWLERDFERIAAAVRVAVVSSPAASPDLAAALLKQQTTFTLAVLAVRGRLLLHAAGIGVVDVRGLVADLDNLRAALGQLTPLPAATRA